mgnify:CR=1 FL=1
MFLYLLVIPMLGILKRNLAETYHSRALNARYRHYFIMQNRTLSELAERNTAVFCDKPFMLIAVFPHPPAGWIHFATNDLEFFKNNFWEAIKLIKHSLTSIGIRLLRVGFREISEHEYLKIFYDLGFEVYERIPIMEKSDLEAPQHVCEDIEIRRATMEDIGDILKIDESNYPPEHRYAPEDLRRLTHNPMFFVATHKKCVVGYLFLGLHGDTGQIVRIAVRPRYQTACVGERLLAFGVEKLFGLGAKKIFARTLEEPRYEMNLLRKFGFKHVDTQISLEVGLGGS